MKNKINLKDFTNAQERRAFLEKETGIDLSSLGNFSFSQDQVKNKNIENLLGAVQIPLGIAGPLSVRGDYAAGDFYLPLATTEGALVASLNRGCKSLGQNGVFVKVENVGISRGAVFKVNGVKQGAEFKNWFKDNLSFLKELVKKTSSHLVLLSADTELVGRSFFVRFVFDSFDAMGMNMATKAVTAIADFLKTKKNLECVSVAGNFDVDKKPSWLNFIKGRGKKVWSEAILSEKTVGEILRTTPEKICEVSYRKVLLGSALSGSMGFNSHYGNVLAALFCATGQDLAHITEGSLGITTTELSGPDLYISVYLPDLIVGTVGGGTGLPAQREALAILGIPDDLLVEGKQVLKLAEIIGGAVLAGEISLLAALASGDLSRAHEKLGRGRK